ncbi:hypothetical protein GCM10022421_10030 [Oceanisphaera sediminis]|uniref:Uncharacterized protein n=1 Tax=Oceanisphaera sediminis TaxID=981381 RepID=A0ABP7DJ29_9GAMM
MSSVVSEVNVYFEVVKIIVQFVIGGLGAFGGYRAAVKKFSETTKDSDKNIFTISVTNERAAWRSELREKTAEFIELGYQFIEGSGKLSELGSVRSHIIMRLNPKAWKYSLQHSLDHKVLKAVNSIYVECERERLNINKLKSDIASLEKHVQNLLKHEWDKSKIEAIEGRERSA